MTRHHEAKAERMGLTRERLAALVDCCGKPNRVGVHHATTATGDLVLDAPFAASLLEELQALRSQPAGVRVKGLGALKRIIPYLDWTISGESPGHHPTMPSAVAAFKDALSALEPQQEEPVAWRDLALQFDNHRIDCLSMLRYAVRNIEEYATVRDILREPLYSLKAFLAKPPLGGEAVLANRIEALAHPTTQQPVAITDEMVERGKAWFDANFNGCPDTETLVEGILTAALGGG
jgi:hypothetical protein